MGGISAERAISLITGKACSLALKKKGYKVFQVDAKGNFLKKIKILKPNFIFNALHGKFGEDGFIQQILENLKIPYTHSGVISSSIAMDKVLSKFIFIKSKIPTPKYFDSGLAKYHPQTADFGNIAKPSVNLTSYDEMFNHFNIFIF